jgi:GxxExxY protein
VPDSHLKHGRITEIILASFFCVFRELGHGFIEPVYEAAVIIDLTARGLFVRPHVPLPVRFRGHLIGEFRPDLLVENCVIVELKAARFPEPKAIAQLLNYLKASEFEVGLLLNFGPSPGFRRLVLDNERKMQPQAGSARSQEPGAR